MKTSKIIIILLTIGVIVRLALPHLYSPLSKEHLQYDMLRLWHSAEFIFKDPKYFEGRDPPLFILFLNFQQFIIKYLSTIPIKSFSFLHIINLIIVNYLTAIFYNLFFKKWLKIFITKKIFIAKLLIFILPNVIFLAFGTPLDQKYFFIGLIASQLSLGTVYFYYLSAKKIGLKNNYLMSFCLILIFVPSLLNLFNFFLMITLLLFIGSIAFYISLVFLERGNTLYCSLNSLFWTLSALCKVSFLPVGLFMSAYAWYQNDHKIRNIIISILIASPFLIANAIRTNKILGYYAPLGDLYNVRWENYSNYQLVKLYFDDYPYIFSGTVNNTMPLAPLSNWMASRNDKPMRMLVEKVYSANGKSDHKKIIDNIPLAFSDYLRIWRESFIMFFFHPSWPDGVKEINLWSHYGNRWPNQKMPGNVLSITNYYFRWIWAIVLAYVIISNSINFFKKRFNLISILTSAYFLFLLFQTQITITGRYRKPIEPLVFLNLVLIIQNRKPKRIKH